MADHTSSPMDLPEICHIIASKLSRPSDLKSWMLTSRTSYEGALPHLYHKVFLRFDEHSKLKIDNFCAPKNRGLNHVRHLRLAPQLSKERGRPAESRMYALHYRLDGMLWPDKHHSEEEIAHWSLIESLICDVLRAIPIDHLQTLSGFRCFPGEAAAILLERQRSLERLYFEPCTVWSRKCLESLPEAPNLLAFKTHCRDLPFKQRRKIATRIISISPKLVDLSIQEKGPTENSIEPGVRAERAVLRNLFDVNLPTQIKSPIRLRKLELLGTDLEDSWQHLPPFIDLSHLQYLYLSNPDSVGAGGALLLLQKLRAHALHQPLRLREFHFSNFRDFEELPDDVRASNEIHDEFPNMLESFSGLRKLSICNPAGENNIPIQPSCLTSHGSTLEMLDMQCWRPSQVSMSNLEELCSTCPNLRQLGLPLFHNHHPSPDFRSPIMGYKDNLTVLAKLRYLEVIKVIGWPDMVLRPGAKEHSMKVDLESARLGPPEDSCGYAGVSHEPMLASMKQDQEAYLEILEDQANALFSQVDAAAASLGYRSRVNVIGFADGSYTGPLVHSSTGVVRSTYLRNWELTDWLERHWRPTVNGEKLEAFVRESELWEDNRYEDAILSVIFLREDVLGPDGVMGKTKARLSSFHDVAYAGEKNDMFHYKHLRGKIHRSPHSINRLPLLQAGDVV